MVLEDSGTCHEVVIATVPTVLVMASPGSRQSSFWPLTLSAWKIVPLILRLLGTFPLLALPPTLSGTYTDQLDHTSSLFCHDLCH